MGNTFCNELKNNSFTTFKQNQIALYDAKIALPTTTASEKNDLQTEKSLILACDFGNAEYSFLELKYLRNNSAHKFLGPLKKPTLPNCSYTHDEVIKIYHSAKLYAGALEIAFQTYTLP